MIRRRAAIHTTRSVVSISQATGLTADRVSAALEVRDDAPMSDVLRVSGLLRVPVSEVLA